jgi:HSP20 family protein
MPSTLTPYVDMAWPRLWSEMMRFPEPFMAGLREESEIRIDEHREDGHLVVHAEVPGIDPEKDVQLSIEDGCLCLQIERRKGSKVSDKDSIREEIHYGQFARRLPLPAGCSEKDVKATYHDGILEVRLPMGGSDARRIPVTVK